MKRSICLLLTLLVILALASAGMTEAEKPAPTLTGATEYNFVGYLGLFDGEGRLLAWEGTITGDIEGTIQWWMAVPMATGQASHYDQRVVILDTAGELLLAADEVGCTTIRHRKNSIWRANGTVTDASEEFADWLGRETHEEGNVTWTPDGLPDHGYGTFRVN